MPIDTSIYQLLRPSTIRGLEPFVEGRKSGLAFRRDFGLAQEEEQARARAEQLRQAFRERYGAAPSGLAGPAPQAAAPPGLGAEAPFPPLAEQEEAATQQALYGSAGVASPMQAPSGPPPSGPYGQTLQAPAGPPPPGPSSRTLEAPGGPPPPGQYAQTMGAGALAQESPSQNPFIRTLYTIDPAAGREAEKHALDSRKLELTNAKERVEHLGRVADGVLAVAPQEAQKAHNIARAQLIQDGMPESQIPVTYDPTIWQMLSGTARTSAERLREGELQLNQAKFQYEQRKGSSKVPDYGLGVEGNRLMHARYGDQIAPGQAPTPAMSQEIEREMVQKGITKARETGLAGAEVAGQRAYEAAVAKPLEGPQLQRINTMMQGEDVVKSLSTEFTAEERKKFVGLGGARMTAQQLQQLYKDVTEDKADPKFARFAALVALGQQEAFSTAGQALSGHERDVVFGYIPTGKEWSAEEFEQKLLLSSQRIPALIDRELVLSTTPRAQLAERRKRGELPSMVPKSQAAFDQEIADLERKIAGGKQ